MNESLAQRLDDLDSILVSGLRTNTRFNLERLKQKPEVTPFEPGAVSWTTGRTSWR